MTRPLVTALPSLPPPPNTLNTPISVAPLRRRRLIIQY